MHGVYDMSGGAYERVSAYVDNGNVNLTIYGESILNALVKYKNIYTMGTEDTKPENYEANKNIYGDAVYETSNTGYSTSGSWYGDRSYMPSAFYPWFGRGGGVNTDVSAGPFNFDSRNGYAGVNTSFRPGLRRAS